VVLLLFGLPRRIDPNYETRSLTDILFRSPTVDGVVFSPRSSDNSEADSQAEPAAREAACDAELAVCDESAQDEEEQSDARFQHWKMRNHVYSMGGEGERTMSATGIEKVRKGKYVYENVIAHDDFRYSRREQVWGATKYRPYG
jgi:hypothetical protein